MCIFGGAPEAPSVKAPPQRRTGGPVAQLYQRRRSAATGVFGNIFTSPLGTSGFGMGTQATRLGGTTPTVAQGAA